MAEEKYKVVTTWLNSCSGCHISILDLDENLLQFLDAMEILHSPVLVDFKEIPKCDIAIIEGAVANEEHEATAKKMREQADIVISIGSCACYGGVPGLRNLYSTKETLETAYVSVESNSNPDGVIPHEIVPKLLNVVKPVHNVIKVDVMIPGCPPPAEMIGNAFMSLFMGETELKQDNKNLCSECELKRDELQQKDYDIKVLKSVMEVIPKPGKCLLEQEILCMGPATRAGCGSRCMKVMMPCRGCMGPNTKAMDQGIEMLNALGPLVLIDEALEKVDLEGTLFRYDLPYAIINSKLNKDKDSGG